ncbi:hypothetical protein FHW88_005632 [Mucilaginibacter sp. SG538B]|uniref:conjugative transposon protein TraM n=1 Tax=Mucilaginibacter sp. SG538B TaxID=2587021 RepID=UPI00159DDF25|nr:conjugative transposon protein TraM [Mucilaginibacter sp. SG538B]NVM67311.1 hypothetical protein [Mucilaginibacter sp. SG538B]
METKNPLKLQRQRKALLVMPLIIFCLSTVCFWAFGGGKGPEPQSTVRQNLRYKIPPSLLGGNQDGDKMSFYDRARADSDKQAQLRKTDPFFKHGADSGAFAPPNDNRSFSPRQPSLFGDQVSGNNDDPAVNAAKISQRLKQLQSVINKPPAPVGTTIPKPALNSRPDSMRYPATLSEDPEMKQMNGLLEKILDIQHPERLKDKKEDIVVKTAPEQFQAIPAVIDGNQKIVQGTVIRIRLLDSVRLNGQLFAKGQLIYGSGDLYNQRVKINIKLIHVGLNIIPVDLTVYDRTDGMEGISVPEAVTGEALREGAVSGVQSMDMLSLDPSVTAQLTTAGINTAKGLFSKKVKRVKGKLKDGHELLLRDNKVLH